MIDGRWWWWRPTVVYRLFSERSALILVRCSSCIDVEIAGQHSVMSEYIMNFTRRLRFHGSFMLPRRCLETVVEGPCFLDGFPRWFLETVVEASASMMVFGNCPPCVFA
ncbi:hypothetical protein TIFTF001_042143 [Ficus carica]|uniref:Secreted protein n=1 Tax=Ficus carica TaxID=3494 RepID=A0AA88CWY9_FICCA|nr:hypothetical protein TIFTF001_042140 [Ficus carica]GMN34960.1 hypothetical protein TIFTF001_042143 [Ficus carica]